MPTRQPVYMPGIGLAAEYTREVQNKNNLSSCGVYRLKQFVRLADVTVTSVLNI